MPLVDQELATDNAATKIYALLRQAERALHGNDGATMGNVRGELQQLAPEVLDNYLHLHAGLRFSAV